MTAISSSGTGLCRIRVRRSCPSTSSMVRNGRGSSGMRVSMPASKRVTRLGWFRVARSSISASWRRVRRVGGLRGKELQCNVPAEVLVPGRVDGCHAAPADHFPEPVAAAQELCRRYRANSPRLSPFLLPCATAAPLKNDTGTGIGSTHCGRGTGGRSAVGMLAYPDVAVESPSGPNDGNALPAPAFAVESPSGPNDGLILPAPASPLSPPRRTQRRTALPVLRRR